MALTYTQWLAANRMRPTAQAAAQWLATAAPAGTAIPTALRSQFGGATRTGGLQTSGTSPYLTSGGLPGQAPGPDPLAAVQSALASGVVPQAPAAKTPPAPIYTPPDPSSDPTLQGIMAQWAGLPGVYNPQRATAASQAAAQLADYSDTPITPQAVGAPGSDQTYQLTLGADGRLYREGAMGDIYSAASGGDVGSSALQNSLADTHRDLDLQAQQILQNWYSGQQQSLASELAQRGQLGTDWGTALGNWQQNQTAIAGSAGSPQQLQNTLTSFLTPQTPAPTTPAAPAPAAARTTTAPAPTTPTVRPRVVNTLSSRSPGPFQTHWGLSGWGKT